MDNENPVISNALNRRHLQYVVCIHITGKQCTGTLKHTSLVKDGFSYQLGDLFVVITSQTFIV